jgi:DNA segregation ATPase FtsK/SpoIIIE-like protein
LWEQLRERFRRPETSHAESVAEREFLEGGALALGIEPKGRFLDRRVRPEPEDGAVLPMPTDAMPVLPAAAPRPRQGRTPLVPGAQLAAAAAASAAPVDPSAEAALAGKALEVYQNLSKWRPLRPEDLVGLNPLEVRELKRRDEEVRRAAMLNEWEDREVQAQVARRPRIAAPEPEDQSAPPVPAPEKPARAPARRSAPVVQPEPEDDEPAEVLRAPEPSLTDSVPASRPAPRPAVKRSLMPAAPTQKELAQATLDASSRYRVPDVSILPDPPSQEVEFDEKALQAMADTLVLQLRNFGVQGKVLQIEPGPVITRFKIELAPGTPVRKISNLSEDLALALKARRIRIQAPIPGESMVGVEIPNRKAETVFIKELLRAPQFRDPKFKLPVVLGKDTAGHPAFTDLSRAPHLLIAGQTGSGKSVCINTILSSLLFSQSPEHLRDLVEARGVKTVPVLRIRHPEGRDEWMPESADIVRYLDGRFGGA